jgi:hypothetical protein
MHPELEIPPRLVRGIHAVLQQEFDAGSSAELAAARWLISLTTQLMLVYGLTTLESVHLIAKVAGLGLDEALRFERSQ